MIALTIGTGNWGEVALRAAHRMHEMTGLGVGVITDEFKEVSHPSWLKCFVLERYPDEDAFLVFDADIICLKPWDPELIFRSMGRAFCAVPDVRTAAVMDECGNLGLPFPDIYVNGGLMMFGREHACVWENTWKRHPKCGKWLEQGALNLALLESGIEVCRLPRWYNMVTYRGGLVCDFQTHEVRDKVVNLHAGSLKPEGLSLLQKQYGMHESENFAQEPSRITR